MARRPRCYIPGFPYHIVQRGNNKQDCFRTIEDYEDYLILWRKNAARYGVSVHAYCLMTNHIHVLATPLAPNAISETLKVVGSTYAQRMNRRYERTGTLWEGRHRSSLIQTEQYLFTCYLYIELNPVRAGMVEHPGDYPWSSYAQNALGKEGWLTAHGLYLRLGKDRLSRCKAYRDMHARRMSQTDLQNIRQATRSCQPVCDSTFRRELEQKFAVRFGRTKTGRPRKSEAG